MPPEVCLLPLEEARHAGARVSLQLAAELQNILHCNSLVGHHVHQGMFLGRGKGGMRVKIHVLYMHVYMYMYMYM